MERVAESRGTSKASLSFRSRCIGLAVAWLVRTLSATCRWRLSDPDGIAAQPPEGPMIWTVWHNRIVAAASLYRRYLRGRWGAVLSSASRDGEVIAAFVSELGVASIRGSSSRRGSSALLGLTGWVRDGYDVLIVPDGPRGPRYRAGPGVIKLAQVTGAPILPIRIEYGSAWRFDSWDRFRLPKPFTTVTVHLGPLQWVPSELGEEEFEGERRRLDELLNPDHETD